MGETMNYKEDELLTIDHIEDFEDTIRNLENKGAMETLDEIEDNLLDFTNRHSITDPNTLKVVLESFREVFSTWDVAIKIIDKEEARL